MSRACRKPNFQKHCLTLSKRQILDSSKMKEFADDNFESDENGRKFSKWVGKNEGKGENACCQQFLLFPMVFSKALYCRQVKTRACLGTG